MCPVLPGVQLDLPILPGEQKLSVSLNGQLADEQLPSTKRMALGGTLANRAYRRDAYLVDSGALLRLDLRTPVRVGEIAVFADAAYGETLNDLDSNWAYLSGHGFSLELQAGRCRKSFELGGTNIVRWQWRCG